jgi:hypothetical protein
MILIKEIILSHLLNTYFTPLVADHNDIEILGSIVITQIKRKACSILSIKGICIIFKIERVGQMLCSIKLVLKNRSVAIKIKV